MYAVIALQGHQYLVKEWDTIVVDKLDLAPGEKLDIKEVLLTFDEKGDKVHIGKPFLPHALVHCTVMDQTQGDKVRVIKFKRKTRYQRTIGFRAKQTVLAINKLSLHE